MSKEKSFKDYKEDADAWITLASGEYYPDILPLACKLYAPVLEYFKDLLTSSHSSVDLFKKIIEARPIWMRIQLSRVFRKYVSPETPVEMLKRKCDVDKICERYGENFRHITEVSKAFKSRPIPDEAICALLWEYKDRGKKGYDLTEQFFKIIEETLPSLKITGPVRAGRDLPLGTLLPGCGKPDRPIDFAIYEDKKLLAVGLARYDSDRGGAQEDDRPGQYRECALDVLTFADKINSRIKVIFINDGPGLLLGSMWNDYAYIEDAFKERVRVVTLRMIPERINLDWLKS